MEKREKTDEEKLKRIKRKKGTGDGHDGKRRQRMRGKKRE